MFFRTPERLCDDSRTYISEAMGNEIAGDARSRALPSLVDAAGRRWGCGTIRRGGASEE
jgi:hypothetical protein